MHSSFETTQTQQHYMDGNTTNASSSSCIFFNPQNQTNSTHHHHHHHLAHPIPITHGLFQGLHQHPIQAQQSLTPHWQQQQMNPPLNFKLGMNETNNSNSNNNPLFLQRHQAFKSWQPQPFWKGSEAEEGVMMKQKSVYGELEAIYSLAKIGDDVNIDSTNSHNNNKQTGSGSALTNENSPKNVEIVTPLVNAGGVDDGLEASIEEEVSDRIGQKRKRRVEEAMSLSSMTRFFEGLVKRVMDHQEGLHNKYLAVIEKMDTERRKREGAWRVQEAEKHKRAAIAQLREQALASEREALIVSFIEKISGEKVEIPCRETPLLLQCDYSSGRAKKEELTRAKGDHECNGRWPQNEVEALILVRSNMESKFQEPGHKGPLWKEVSAAMAALGYQRSAKRCKEKWENINKYFKKTKDSPKKRPQQSKTCSYFNQLDQLYSRTLITSPPSSSYCSSNPVVCTERQGYSELLQAVITGNDTGISQNLSSGNFELLSELGSDRLDFSCITNGKVKFMPENQERENECHEDDRSMEEEDDEEQDTHGDDSDE